MRFTDDYLQTRYVNIKSDKVFNDFKMMVIGDIHMSSMVSLSKIKTIKEKIVKEKPDYIFYVGDLIDRIEELDNDSSLKLRDLLEFSTLYSKTFVILGNHDFIYRVSKNTSYKIVSFINSIKNVHLLNNDVYFDDKIYLMGYTQTQKYYCTKNYDYDDFYNDFIKKEKLYKNVNKSLFTIALIHSPEFSSNDKCLSLFDDYNLIISGHMHDGCVPFGIGKFKWGIVNPKKNLFPKNVRGIRKLKNNYILITGGITKIQKCAPKILHPLNHLCPMQLDVINVSNGDKFKIDY